LISTTQPERKTEASSASVIGLFGVILSKWRPRVNPKAAKSVSTIFSPIGGPGGKKEIVLSIPAFLFMMIRSVKAIEFRLPRRKTGRSRAPGS
jgi:hypothetical protein